MTLQQAIAYMEGRLASTSVRGVPVAFYRDNVAFGVGAVGILDGTNADMLVADGSSIQTQVVDLVVSKTYFTASHEPARGDIAVIGTRRFQVFPAIPDGPAVEPVDVYAQSIRIHMKEVKE